MSVRVRPRERSRIERALVCPFCRDSVSSRSAVSCARRGCGALYHRDCWEECRSRYGGCAVFGCESRAARELCVLGFLARWIRLAVAAALFPGRVLAVTTSSERFRVSVRDAIAAHVRCFFADFRRGWRWPALLIAAPAVFASLSLTLFGDEDVTANHAKLAMIWTFPAAVWIVPWGSASSRPRRSTSSSPRAAASSTSSTRFAEPKTATLTSGRRHEGPKK